MRPHFVVRFAAESYLLISGMLAGGSELANDAAVVDMPRGKGHVVMFANNPMWWRYETQGSYFLLFNAMFNYDHLAAGVQAAPRAQAEDVAAAGNRRKHSVTANRGCRLPSGRGFRYVVSFFWHRHRPLAIGEAEESRVAARATSVD
jgi:hypothetical protein